MSGVRFYKLPDEEFTLEVALSIQEMQLKEWETVLKPEVFAKLSAYVLKQNEGVTNPYHVFRGTEISCVIGNMAMGHEYD